MNTENSHTLLDTLSWLLAGESHADVRDDPAYQAARERLDADPALQTRFEEEKAFSTRFDSLVATASLPVDARERILKTLEAASASRRRIAWPNQKTLAWVAALVLFLGGGLFYLQQAAAPPTATGAIASYPATMKGFRDFSAHVIDGKIQLQHRNSEFGNLQQWLDTKGVEAFKAPTLVTEGSTIGCQVLDWNGHTVSLICLNTTTGVVHMFVTNLKTLEGDVEETSLGEKVVQGHDSRAWIRNENVYVFISGQRGQPLPDFSI